MYSAAAAVVGTAVEVPSLFLRSTEVAARKQAHMTVSGSKGLMNFDAAQRTWMPVDMDEWVNGGWVGAEQKFIYM